MFQTLKWLFYWFAVYTQARFEEDRKWGLLRDRRLREVRREPKQPAALNWSDLQFQDWKDRAEAILNEKSPVKILGPWAYVKANRELLELEPVFHKAMDDGDLDLAESTIERQQEIGHLLYGGIAR